jgi:cold shock CspA family protein
METPVQIDFQGMQPAETIRAAIKRHISGLEDRFGRITACRVVLKGPGQHHRTGGLYEVNIHLALPNGKEVNIARTPIADERHADVTFALNDAFKRARRQLQDEARRLQGQIKIHEHQPIGIVTKIADEFGFLATADGREIYFHRHSVIDNAFNRLKVGTNVSFSEGLGEKGPQASTVKLIGKHRLRA